MSIKTEKIDVTPHRSIMPKLGQTGYSVSEALAELIDNSIDSRDLNEEGSVTVEILIDRGKDTIIIEDNGIGMNKDTAKSSMVLGHSRKKKGELGQFGLGLKTACMNLGKHFTVETTQKNSDELYILPFDEGEFLEKGKWDKFEIKIKDGIDIKYSGTKIVIQKLRISFHANLLESIKKHLAERFAPFIRNGEAVIKINGKILTPETVKIDPSSKKKFSIKLKNGAEVNGWTGILERGSYEQSGFNLYRFGRLIRVHDKLGYVYHPSKMWVMGEIYMDPLPVTHDKREFITSDPLYADFFDKFKNILKGVLDEAKRKHREEQIRDLPKHVRETLKDNLLEALDKMPDFKELAFPELRQPSQRSDGGELSDQEKRDYMDREITSTEIAKPITNKPRSPKKTSEKKVRFITIAGQKFEFDWRWAPLDSDLPKMANLDRENNFVDVILNNKYPILNVIKPDVFYVTLYVTEGLVEVFLIENGQPMDKVFFLRDKLIRTLANIMAEEDSIKEKEASDNIVEAHAYLLKTKAGKGSSKLTDNEKRVLEGRLEKNYTVVQLAVSMKLSRQRIDQLFRSSLKKISQIDKISLELPSHKMRKVKLAHISSVISGSSAVVAEDIIRHMAKSYSITARDLLGRKRKAELVLPRHLSMYLLRKKLNLSYPKIGKIFGKRDHTTAIFAYKKIDKLITSEKISFD